MVICLPPLTHTVAGELEQMFIKQSSLEVYFEWLDSVIDRRVNEVRAIETLYKGLSIIQTCTVVKRVYSQNIFTFMPDVCMLWCELLGSSEKLAIGTCSESLE